MGAISAVMKEASPAEVVREAMITAIPEWLRAQIMASLLSPSRS